MAIGNAPTALFRLLELIDAGAPKPAAILGIPGNTVKTRMFHARRTLSELLAARGVVGALA